MNTLAANRGLLGASAALFAASAAITVLWCGSMSAMPGMEMPGGWTMSMAWMRMPGQSWPGAATSFLGMWSVMMVAMMLPSLVPMLMRYRASVDGSSARLSRLTALVAAGYYFVWILAGVAAYPLGLALAAAEMQLTSLARAVPIATGLVVMLAGVLQFTAWKAHRLECCRSAPPCCRSHDSDTAWRHGLRLGLNCVQCCAGLTAVLIVLGVMDLRAMALVTLAISAERIAPASERVAHHVGAFAIAGGIWMVSNATAP